MHGSERIWACGWIGLWLLSVAPSVRAEEASDSEGSPGAIRFEPSFALGRVSVGWVWEPEVPGLYERCGPACAPQGVGGPSLRVGGALLLGGIALEADYGWERARGPAGGGRRALRLGVRLDSSAESTFSLYFRFAWVQRFGELNGSGGLAGIGLQLRILQGRATFFAEAEAEAVSVSELLQDRGAVFSWGTWNGFGLRLGFG